MRLYKNLATQVYTIFWTLVKIRAKSIAYSISQVVKGGYCNDYRSAKVARVLALVTKEGFAKLLQHSP